MKKNEKLEEMGYKVKWTQVKTSLPGAASAMSAGKIDMAYPNSLTAMTTFAKSPKTAWFVGRGFTNMNNTVIRNKSGIKTYKQMADQKVAMSGKKTASTLYYEVMLHKHNVKPNRDKYFVSGTGPSMVGALASGGVNVAASYEPYSTEAVQKGVGHIKFTASDALGFPAPGDGLVVRKQFAKKHPKATSDVLRVMFSAMDKIKKDPQGTAPTIANYAKVKTSVVTKLLNNEDVFPKSYEPDERGMLKVARLAQHNKGFVPKGTSLPSFTKKLINKKYAKKALAH
jgi:ABC-type nitrate/sulfonate/bicarbonate transport system substrate-binding protein